MEATITNRRIKFEQLGDLVGMNHGVLEDEPGMEKILVSPSLYKLLNDPEEREAVIKSLWVCTRDGLRRAEDILR